LSTSRDFISGNVLTASQMDDLEQGVIAMATPLTTGGTTSGTTELTIITAPAVTIAQTNRRIKVSFSCRGYSSATANDVYIIRIKEGATTFNEQIVVITTTATTLSTGNVFHAWIDSPTAASHTYSATIQRSSGTGTATVAASATAPINLAVEDVGTV